MLMGDFNIDLLKYDANADSVTTPTRVTAHWKSLIDNMFLNNIDSGLISGNIISTISDHFAQFLL